MPKESFYYFSCSRAGGGSPQHNACMYKCIPVWTRTDQTHIRTPAAQLCAEVDGMDGVHHRDPCVCICMPKNPMRKRISNISNFHYLAWITTIMLAVLPFCFLQIPSRLNSIGFNRKRNPWQKCIQINMHNAHAHFKQLLGAGAGTGAGLRFATVTQNLNLKIALD